MPGIHSFNETMTLDRGILETLNSPLATSPLPDSRKLAPPGALRGVVDDNFELVGTSLDPLLVWAMERPDNPEIMTPRGFQSALGDAVGALSAEARASASDPAAQAALRSCARLVTEQMELIQLAEINRSSLMQG